VSERIGFLVYTAQTSLPTYVGGIQGFSASDEEDIATIRSLVQQGFSGPEIAPIIAEISAEGDLRHLPEEERITKILDTLRVQMVNICAPGGSLHPIANLYINCSFDNDEGWTRLVAKLEYCNSLIGTGVYHPGWTCTICHGVDHPSGLCPFPQLPGWLNAIPIRPILDYRNQLMRNSDTPAGKQRGASGGNQRGRGGNNSGARARGGFKWGGRRGF
jgi:hypothetical protein